MIKDLIEISTTELKNANFRKSFKRLLLAECIHNLNVLERFQKRGYLCFSLNFRSF